MADRKLKIIFSGISTLHPGPPRTRSETPPEKAFVLMAANASPRENDWKALIEPHVPFVYLPLSVIGEPIPEPDDWVDDKNLGRCNIYYLANARVSVAPSSSEKLRYYIHPEHDLAERPGSDDVADEDDIRWLANLRELVPPDHAPLRNGPDAPGPEVAAIVELTGGTLKAGFPCKSVQVHTFRAFNEETIPGIARVLADEFSVEMTYPEATPQVTLRVRPLRRDGKDVRLDALTLRWPQDAETLEVRMGNDTAPEARLVTSIERCNARIRPSTRTRLRPRDDDFFLHYELLRVPPGGARPLPQAGPHQTSGDGCKPSGGG